MTTERTRRRRAFVLGATAMLVLGSGTLVAWAIVGPQRSEQVILGAGTNGDAVAASSPALSISGSLALPLRPGTGERLDLVIANDTSAAIAVTELTVRIVEIVAPRATPTLGCSIDDFSVAQSTFEFELAGASSTSLTGAGANDHELPLLSMRDTDVDQAGCVGATLSLEYAAIGTPA